MITVFYNNDPLAQDMGGGAEHFRGLRRALRRAGLPHRLIAARLQEERSEPEVIYVSEGANFLRFAIGAALWARRHRALFGADDVIHFHRSYLHWPLRWALGDRARRVLTYHNMSGRVLEGALGRAAKPLRAAMLLLERRAAREVDALICVSERDRRQLDLEVSTAFAEALVTPAGFEEGAFRGVAPLSPSRAREVLFAGRLSRQKNAPLAIRAFERAAADAPERWRLTIAGDGEDAPQVLALIAQSPLRARIRALGRVAHDRMSALFEEVGVLLLTSRYEASPTVVKEALSCGRYVVSTDVGDVARWIDPPRAGLLAAPDERALAEALRAAAARIEAGGVVRAATPSEADSIGPVIDLYRRLGA